MRVFDAVLSDTERQLGITGNSATSVLSGILALITQDGNGLGGLLDRFRRAGFDSIVSSWLSGDPKPLGAGSVEAALGYQAVERIGAGTGLPSATTASAIALMLPKMIQRLAPGGLVPSRLPSEVTQYLSAGATAVSSGARSALSGVERAAPSGLGHGVRWLIIGACLTAAVWWLLARRNQEPAFDVLSQTQAADERALSALAALRPGFAANELTMALNLGAINFQSASAAIPAEAVPYLGAAAAALESAPAGTAIEVSGHTDTTGSAAANLTLSQERADAVRTYLVQQGVPPAMLSAKGYGDSRPVAANDTEEGRFLTAALSSRLAGREPGVI